MSVSSPFFWFEKFKREYLEFRQSVFAVMYTDQEKKERREELCNQILALDKKTRKDQFLYPMENWLLDIPNNWGNHFFSLILFFYDYFSKQEEMEKLALLFHGHCEDDDKTEKRNSPDLKFKTIFKENLYHACMQIMRKNPSFLFPKQCMVLLSTYKKKSPAHELLCLVASFQKKRAQKVTAYDGITFRKHLYRLVPSVYHYKRIVLEFLMQIDSCPIDLYIPLYEFCLPGQVFCKDSHTKILDIFFDKCCNN